MRGVTRLHTHAQPLRVFLIVYVHLWRLEWTCIPCDRIAPPILSISARLDFNKSLGALNILTLLNNLIGRTCRRLYLKSYLDSTKGKTARKEGDQSRRDEEMRAQRSDLTVVGLMHQCSVWTYILLHEKKRRGSTILLTKWQS